MSEKFISSEGSIGRIAFAVRIFLLALFTAVVTHYALDFFSEWHDGTFRPLGVFVGIVTGMFCVLIGLMQLLKRLRDLGKAPYLSLLLLLPGINLLLLVYAMLVPGKAK